MNYEEMLKGADFKSDSVKSKELPMVDNMVVYEELNTAPAYVNESADKTKSNNLIIILLIIMVVYTISPVDLFPGPIDDAIVDCICAAIMVITKSLKR